MDFALLFDEANRRTVCVREDSRPRNRRERCEKITAARPFEAIDFLRRIIYNFEVADGRLISVCHPFRLPKEEPLHV